MAKKIKKSDIRNILREEFIDIVRERRESRFKISKSRINSIIQEEVSRALSVLNEQDDDEGDEAEAPAGDVDLDDDEEEGSEEETGTAPDRAETASFNDRLRSLVGSFGDTGLPGLADEDWPDQNGPADQANVSPIARTWGSGDHETVRSELERIRELVPNVQSEFGSRVASDEWKTKTLGFVDALVAQNDRVSPPAGGAQAARVEEPVAAAAGSSSGGRYTKKEDPPFEKFHRDASGSDKIGKLQKVAGAPSAKDKEHGDGWWGPDTDGRFNRAFGNEDSPTEDQAKVMDDDKIDQAEFDQIVKRWGALAGTDEEEASEANPADSYSWEYKEIDLLGDGTTDGWWIADEEVRAGGDDWGGYAIKNDTSKHFNAVYDDDTMAWSEPYSSQPDDDEIVEIEAADLVRLNLHNTSEEEPDLGESSLTVTGAQSGGDGIQLRFSDGGRVTFPEDAESFEHNGKTYDLSVLPSLPVVGDTIHVAV